MPSRLFHISLVFLALTLAHARGLIPLKQPVTLPATAGKVVNGLALELSAPAEAWYVVGDMINVKLTVRNTAEKDQCFLLDACCTFYDHVFMVDKDNLPCDADMARERLAHAPASWPVVKAGGGLPLDETLNHWVQITQPGTYTVWFTYGLTEEQAKNAWHKPVAAPWHGELVSNPVKVTVISLAEYQKLEGTPVTQGEFKGLTLGLRSVKPVYRLGEALAFQVLLKNTTDGPMSVPWEKDGRLFRLSDAPLPESAREWSYGEKSGKIALKPGETQAVDMPTNNLHVSNGLLGTLSYRADFWVTQPAAANTPLEPIRTVSPEVTIRIEVTEADMDRLLKRAAADIASDNGYRSRSQALNALCASLETVTPWLPAHANGNGPAAKLADDLLVAGKLKTLLAARKPDDPEPCIILGPTGEVSLQPAGLTDLVGLIGPTHDDTAFALAFIHLKLCAGYVGKNIPDTLSADAQTPLAAIKALTTAVMSRAEAEKVYIYRLQMEYADEGKGKPTLDLNGNMSCSMLIGVGTSEHGEACYTLLPYPNPDPRPNFFSGWDQQEFKAALAGLPKIQEHLTLEELTRALNARTRRHEQIYLVPLADARWGQVVDAAKAIRAWNPCALAMWMD